MSRRKLGALLVAAGIILIAVGPLVAPVMIARLTTAYYIPTELLFYSTYPNEGTKDGPFVVRPGENLYFTACISHRVEDSSGEVVWDFDGPIYVKVHVYDEGGSELASLWLERWSTADGSGNKVYSGVTYKCYYWAYHDEDGPWTTPGAEGLYKVVFECDVYDGSTYIGEWTKTVWIEVRDAPDGYFVVEGVKITDWESAQPIVVSEDGVLDFEFHATAHGEDIEHVRVEVYSSGSLVKVIYLDESTPDQVWTGSYQLPGPGVYELKGWVTDTTGESFRKLSMIIEHMVEEAPSSSGWVTDIIYGLGIVMLLGGAVLIGIGGKRKE